MFLRARRLAITGTTLLSLALVAPAARPDDALERDIAALVRGSGARADDVGVCVIDDRGRTLVALAADTPLKPASNQKLIVTAAALSRLGERWEYVTRVFANGPIVGGEIQGDLRIYSNGEPNISGRFHDGDVLYLFRAWARGLHEAGIRRVRGDLVADARAFDDVRFNEGWPEADAGRWFCAEISPLTVNDNCVTVRVHPTRPGAPARVELDPPSRHVRVVGAPTTGGSGAKIRIHRQVDGDGMVLQLGGTISSSTRNWFDEVAVVDPALFYARAFEKVLEDTGIRVEGSVRKRIETAAAGSSAKAPDGGEPEAPGAGVDADPASVDSARATPAGAKGDRGGIVPAVDGARADPGAAAPGERVLVEHRSPLTLDLPIINKRSQNLHAELLLKALGRVVEGDGSVRGGETVVRRLLAKFGVDAGGLVIADASGLSHSNRATTRAIATLLDTAGRSSWGQTFRDSLAVAGVDGTLARRFRGYPALKGSVVGKTGTIRGVSALSGYVERDGRRFVFSILVNSLPGGSLTDARRLEERIVERVHRAMAP